MGNRIKGKQLSTGGRGHFLLEEGSSRQSADHMALPVWDVLLCNTESITSSRTLLFL